MSKTLQFFRVFPKVSIVQCVVIRFVKEKNRLTQDFDGTNFINCSCYFEYNKIKCFFECVSFKKNKILIFKNGDFYET